MNSQVRFLGPVLVAAASLALPAVALAEGPLDDTPAFSISAVAKPSLEGVNFSNRIGLSAESFGGWAVVGFDRSGRHINGDNSTRQAIQAGLGGRYLFSTPERSAAAPYIYVQGVTDRRSAQSDRDEVDDLVSDVKRYSLFAGFGGEVAITPALSLAAEIGFQHDVQDYEEREVRLMSIHTHLDTGLVLNAYF